MFSWVPSSLRAKGKTAYARITLNRVTASFFIFSFIYCFLQGIIQSLLFSIDLEYSVLVSGIVNGGNIPPGNITFLEGVRGRVHVQICDDIPHGQPRYPCTTVFNSTHDSPKYNGGVSLSAYPQQTFVLGNWQNGLEVTSEFDPSNSTNVIGVKVETEDGSSVTLSEQCIQILLHPSQILLNFRREDIAWVCLQFWLLAISFLAIINDSVPHILAALMTRALAVGWAMYAIWRTPYFRGNFQEFLADPGTPCSLDIFSDYWKMRQGYEIADLILSCTGIVVFAYLSWNLLKMYSAQSYKRLGAPEHVMRFHKFFMAVLACLQMEAFVLVTSMGLWIDVLMNTAIARISAHTPIYKALFIATAILLLPWIAMGWYSIRREMRKMMIIFLAIAFIITTGWAIMFYSIVYRWSFVQWPYLGCFTVASFVLLIASMTLGVICRINFGKGLAQYLHAEEALASLGFAPDSFVHERSSTRYSKDAKSFDKGDLEDYNPDSMPMYFVSALPTLKMNSTGGQVTLAPLPSARSPPHSRSISKDQPFNVPF
ncbi:hypothetical protein B0H34DRAFT_720077 [Crassisporium funariophilum]|nr:hypothetical protein B0H34DRAFT_720077 [Crassisporium funariophilum]